MSTVASPDEGEGDHERWPVQFFHGVEMTQRPDGVWVRVDTVTGRAITVRAKPAEHDDGRGFFVVWRASNGMAGAQGAGLKFSAADHLADRFNSGAELPVTLENYLPAVAPSPEHPSRGVGVSAATAIGGDTSAADVAAWLMADDVPHTDDQETMPNG